MTLSNVIQMQRDRRELASRVGRAHWKSGLLLGLAVPLLMHTGLASAFWFSDRGNVFKEAEFNDVKGIQQALQQGADPNSVDETGLIDSTRLPLLMAAIRYKANGVAMALINNEKTDINAQNQKGENALMYAAITKNLPLVQALLDKGAQVNKQGWTPLHYAASVGDDQIVKVLLAHNAQVDALSPNGTTPLMMAARSDQESTVKLLLAAGANPDIKNQVGWSAMDFAQNYANDTKLAALIGNGDQTYASAGRPMSTDSGKQTVQTVAAIEHGKKELSTMHRLQVASVEHKRHSHRLSAAERRREALALARKEEAEAAVAQPVRSTVATAAHVEPAALATPAVLGVYGGH